MHPNLNPKDDSQWMAMPPIAKRTARERFIYRAAKRYGLVHDGFRAVGLRCDRVEKSFYEALSTCPLPDGATSNWNFQPGAEDIFIHLTLSRLEGKPLPVSLDIFAPLPTEVLAQR